MSTDLKLLQLQLLIVLQVHLKVDLPTVVLLVTVQTLQLLKELQELMQLLISDAGLALMTDLTTTLTTTLKLQTKDGMHS